MNFLETPKCNWNLFRPKEMFYMIPKCILVITKLSIIEMLSQWNWKNKKPYVVILSHWLFVKAMMIFFSYVLSDGNCNVNFELHLKIWMVVMVTIVFVDARWIESRFVVTAYNIEIVSCDFHGCRLCGGNIQTTLQTRHHHAFSFRGSERSYSEDVVFKNRTKAIGPNF